MPRQLVQHTNQLRPKRKSKKRRKHGVADSIGGAIRDGISEYQRARSRAQMMSFFLGVMACISLGLCWQNLTRTPDIAQQPVIYRFDDDLVQPVSTQRRKAPKPMRKPNARNELLQAEWR